MKCEFCVSVGGGWCALTEKHHQKPTGCNQSGMIAFVSLSVTVNCNLFKNLLYILFCWGEWGRVAQTNGLLDL